MASSTERRGEEEMSGGVAERGCEWEEVGRDGGDPAVDEAFVEVSRGVSA